MIYVKAGCAQGDPLLNYFALGLLIFVVAVLFYGIVAITPIPYAIGKKRNHPHCWVSLFTLQVLWPFLWIWAMAYRPERGWGFSSPSVTPTAEESELEDLRRRTAKLESSIATGGRSINSPA